MFYFSGTADTLIADEPSTSAAQDIIVLQDVVDGKPDIKPAGANTLMDKIENYKKTVRNILYI